MPEPQNRKHLLRQGRFRWPTWLPSHQALLFSARSHLLPLLGLILVTLAFYWPLWLRGWWLPSGGGDLASFLWPSYRFAAQTLWQGRIPLWNPHLYAGAPFAADNQMGLFYPINWVSFLLAGPSFPYSAMEGLVIFHTFWAGAGFYVFLCRLKQRPLGAWAGAVAFSLSDLFVTHVGNLNLNATASWLGWLLVALEGTRGRSFWRAAIAAGVVLGLAALAGHGQIWLYLALVAVLWAIASAWLQRKLSPLGAAAVAIGVAAGIAAVLLIPGYELVRETARARLSLEEASRYALRLPALVGLLWPDFWGRGRFFRGPWERVEVGYAGAVTLVLALAVPIGVSWFARRRSRRENALPRYSVILGAVFLLAGFAFALGRDLPFYRLLINLPGFGSLRASARFVLVGNAGLAILAACALSSLPRLRRPLIASVALGLLALALIACFTSQPLSGRAARGGMGIALALAATGVLAGTATRFPRAASLGIAILVAIELLVGGSTLEVDPNDPTADFFALPDVVAYLKDAPGFFRIDVDGGWPPDAALVHGLYDMWGVYNPLTPAIYTAYRWSIVARGDPLYDLLGVKYVIASKGHPPGDERLVPVYDRNPRADLYLNQGGLPRILLVHRARSAQTFGEAWDIVHDPDFTPEQEVVVEGGPPLAGTSSSGDRHLALGLYDLHQVEIEVTTPQTGYLVLSDTWYPGWRARLDGEPVPLYRANAAFRAVRVPPGRHRVRLDFRPLSWYIGLSVSLVTWGGLGLSAWREIRSQASRARSRKGARPG